MTSTAIVIEAVDQAGEARRAVIALATKLGLGETIAGRAAVVVMECATNILKHAGSGQIVLSALSEGMIEVLALDKGPGMENVEACARDGYSTVGSPGTGLGAIRRLSSECEIYSAPGKGTAVLSRIWNGTQGIRGRPVSLGAVSVAKAGEEVSGDDWAFHQGSGYATLMVVDGLGHGRSAADGAAAAIIGFRKAAEEQPVPLLMAVHRALQPTRGAAASVARIDFETRTVRYAGIGNVGGVISGPEEVRQMVSMPGIAGHNARNVREFTYAWPQRSLVLLYSDGLGSHWSLDTYPGLAWRDPALIAGVLYRDWSRGRDDATIVAIRERAA
jgi:anti-sigma regulatory factor (Ser/Thr protein kinase)